MTTEIEIAALDVRVLHAVRVGGWLSAERIAAWVPEAAGAIEELVDRGLLKAVDTPQGRLFGLAEGVVLQVDSALTAGAVDVPAASVVADLLADFERSDPVLKERVTAFQRTRDAAGAAAIVEFHRARTDLIDRIGAASVLWSGYPERFRRAVAAVEAGDLDHVASPLLDSYHTVWHLLHRDLRAIKALPVG
ncbi:hypothetical protein ACFYTQ_36220 [Nocardia sp. NPDC004068]|uniref:hypothetical protein n=1 Tax=Nocardia sp. NPDC004068 TaxID=3364303 RepID=UPI003687D94E